MRKSYTIVALLGLALLFGTNSTKAQTSTSFEASEACSPSCNVGDINFTINGASFDGNSGNGARIMAPPDVNFLAPDGGTQAYGGTGAATFSVTFTDLMTSVTMHFAHGTCVSCGPGFPASFPASIARGFDNFGTACTDVASIDVSGGADATVTIDKDLQCAGNAIKSITFDGAVVDGMSWVLLTLPVELSSLEAIAQDQNIVLTWQTASEHNNAGFEVEHRTDESQPFQSIGFVAGSGDSSAPTPYRYEVTDNAPGRHLFRLKQVDFDGSFNYSAEVSAFVGIADAYEISAAYPNPFNSQAQLGLAVAQQQYVTVSVFDMLGRRVQNLYSGLMPANSVQDLRVNAAELPNGIYFVRAVGERFNATRKVTLYR